MLCDADWSHGHQYQLAVSLEGTFGELTPAAFDNITAVVQAILGSNLKRCTLLDIGSGRGRLAMCISYRVCLRAVLGIELDERLHSFAQENSMGSQATFAKGDLNRLTSFRGANIILGSLLCACVSAVCVLLLQLLLALPLSVIAWIPFRPCV